MTAAMAEPPHTDAPLAPRGNSQEERLAFLRQVTASIDVAPAGDRAYSVLVWRAREDAPQSRVLSVDDLQASRQCLFEALVVGDPPHHVADYRWGGRGFSQGGDDRWAAIAAATCAFSMPLLLARLQTRREACVLRARVQGLGRMTGATSGLSASVHGPDEEPEEHIPSEAIQTGEATHEALHGGSGGALAALAQSLGLPAPPAGLTSGGMGGALPTLRAGMLGYFDVSLIPARTLPNSEMLQMMISHNQARR